MRYGYIALLVLMNLLYTQRLFAQEVSHVATDKILGQVSWMVGGTPWYAVLETEPYFENAIPVIGVELETRNETPLGEVDKSCFYRGSLSDMDWHPIKDTYVFFNFCNDNLPFTGFVSDINNVYRIEEDPSGFGELLMVVDDLTLSHFVSDDSANSNNGGNGSGQVIRPETQITRNSMPSKFPSVEFMIDSSYRAKFGDPGYIYRAISTLAFSNFIYELNDMKAATLISINVLNGTLNNNGGIGAIKHQLQNLRRDTVQPTSGDISILLLGTPIDSTYTWGWGIEDNACELQIAVNEGDKINTAEVGRSAAFFIDLPSLIQRGWIFAHELGHVIGASKHVDGDPLMDGWFLYVQSLAGYVAGCEAITQIFESCDYDSKSRKLTDFYECTE
jgi:hypothetical protein